MPHLHATIAALPDRRAKAESVIAKVYQGFRKAGGFSGQSRVYTRTEEEGLEQPPQFQRVQVQAEDELNRLQDALGELFDAALTQEVGNTHAAADVVVDGETVLADVPVTYLLFLERQLAELRTTLVEMPELSPEDVWTWHANFGCWATAPTTTYSTRKTPTPIVLYAATDKHPAQVQVHDREIPVGTWETIKLSGAAPVARKVAMLARLDKLRIAVKVAREEANSVEVQPMTAQQALFGYLFDGEVSHG